VKAGRDWRTLEKALSKPMALMLANPASIAWADQGAKAYAETFAEFGIDVRDPDDLYTVIATMEILRSAFSLAGRRREVIGHTVDEARSVIRAMEIMLADFAPAGAWL
jgi:hypothetical protein